VKSGSEPHVSIHGALTACNIAQLITLAASIMLITLTVDTLCALLICFFVSQVILRNNPPAGFSKG
jgi:hypothetical protein